MKDSISANLIDGEEIRYQTRLHWVLYLRTILLFLLAMIAFVLSRDAPDLLIIGILILLSAIGYTVYLHLLIKTSDFAITSRRFYMKRGIISKKTFEILLSKTESISLEQSLTGRILGYGIVIIGGTGGSKERFVNIKGAAAFRKIAQEEINKTQATGSLPK